VSDYCTKLLDLSMKDRYEAHRSTKHMKMVRTWGERAKEFESKLDKVKDIPDFVEGFWHASPKMGYFRMSDESVQRLLKESIIKQC